MKSTQRCTLSHCETQGSDSDCHGCRSEFGVWIGLVVMWTVLTRVMWKKGLKRFPENQIKALHRTSWPFIFFDIGLQKTLKCFSARWLFTMLCIWRVLVGAPGQPGSLVPDGVVRVAVPVFVLVGSAWSNQMRQPRSIHPAAAAASSSSLTVKLLTPTPSSTSLDPIHVSF